jgi:hypothetical protein
MPREQESLTQFQTDDPWGDLATLKLTGVYDITPINQGQRVIAVSGHSVVGSRPLFQVQKVGNISSFELQKLESQNRISTEERRRLESGTREYAMSQGS